MASSLSLTCLTLIKSTLYPNLVIFTSKTLVEFVIFFIFLQPRALANSVVSSKLDYCNSLYSGISQANLNTLQRIQNSLARVITNTSKHHNNTQKTTLASNQTKNWLLTQSSHIQNTNQYTHLYNSLSFPSHSVSTRSSDSLVLSIPYNYFVTLHFYLVRALNIKSTALLTSRLTCHMTI